MVLEEEVALITMIPVSILITLDLQAQHNPELVIGGNRAPIITD